MVEPSRPLRVLVYSDNPRTREQVQLALGKRVHPELPELWAFVCNNLPSTLRAEKRVIGYGHVLGVYLFQSPKPAGKHWWSLVDDPMIASVHNDEIEIFQPQYFSDFEKITTDYEDMGGEEITIKLWESEELLDHRKRSV